MTSKVKTLALAIQSTLEGLTDGETEPTYYFDHVWIGMPKKIPMGDRCISIIEIASQPNYYYTTCAEQTQYDVDFYINVMIKGHVENATLYAYEVIEALQTEIFSDQKFGGACIGSTVEEVMYGDYWEEAKSLVTGARITLRCRL